MITHLPYSNYINMPWKNNQGSTLQIDIDSTHSENYLWRLSAATIKNESTFSKFENYSRLLTIWKGTGLLLNDTNLLQNQIHRFKGEDTIICKNLSAEVIDLGLIFNHKQLLAEMNILNLTTNTVLNINSYLTFLFCAEGQFQYQNTTCFEGDTLKIQNENSISIFAESKNIKLIQIKLVLIS